MISCDAAPVIPDSEDFLAQLRARAGITEAFTDGTRKRTYKDNSLGQIVEYFDETIRQKELMGEDLERAKAEAKRAQLKRDEGLTAARADLKIVEAKEEDRIAELQAELQDKEASRNKAAQERNAAIKETSAQYEFDYKLERLNQEMQLAAEDGKLVKLKEAVEASIREQKRLDIEKLEIEREKMLANIRGEERKNSLMELGKLLDGLKELPVPNYSGVQTLVAGGSDSRDQVTSLLLGVLGSLTDGLSLGPSTEPIHRRRTSPNIETQVVHQTENMDSSAQDD